MRKLKWGSFKSSSEFYKEVEKFGENFHNWFYYLELGRRDPFVSAEYRLASFVAQFAVGGKERIRSPINRSLKNYCLSFGKDFVKREFNEVLRLSSLEVRKCSKEISTAKVEET